MIRLTNIPGKLKPGVEKENSFEYWMRLTLPEEYANLAIKEPARKVYFRDRRPVYTTAHRALTDEFLWSESRCKHYFWVNVRRWLDGTRVTLPEIPT